MNFELSKAFLVDGGRFSFGTMELAQVARKVFAPGTNIQTVLAVKTPRGLVLTNPLIVLEVDDGTQRVNSST